MSLKIACEYPLPLSLILKADVPETAPYPPFVALYAKRHE